jgi:hypothetical protein
VLRKSIVSWCTAGLDAMEDLCSESLDKQAVSEKVKSLTCASSSEVSAKLVDGNLTYAFPFSSASNQNKLLIRSYLGQDESVEGHPVLVAQGLRARARW